MRGLAARLDGLPSAQVASFEQQRKASLLPRFYFNARIGDELIRDPEGEELRDADQAWEFAHSLALELLLEEAEQPLLLTSSVEVMDENGEMVLDLPLIEAATGQADQSETRH
jgi:hypothetical protein